VVEFWILNHPDYLLRLFNEMSPMEERMPIKNLANFVHRLSFRQMQEKLPWADWNTPEHIMDMAP
jgi:hypothetical protein